MEWKEGKKKRYWMWAMPGTKIRFNIWNVSKRFTVYMYMHDSGYDWVCLWNKTLGFATDGEAKLFVEEFVKSLYPKEA